MEFATLLIACESRFQICLLERMLIFSHTSILLLFIDICEIPFLVELETASSYFLIDIYEIPFLVELDAASFFFLISPSFLHLFLPFLIFLQPFFTPLSPFPLSFFRKKLFFFFRLFTSSRAHYAHM